MKTIRFCYLLIFLMIILAGCKDDIVTDPDNMVPSVYLTIENTSFDYVQYDTIVLRALVEDEDGIVEKVKFYNGEDLLFEDSSVPFRYEWILLDAGEFTFSAVVYDDDGAWSESQTVDILVLSATYPHIEITAPYPNNHSISEGSDFYIRCEAWDYDGTIGKIEVYVNDALLNTHLNTDDCMDTVFSASLGTYIIKALAFDDKGNESLPSVEEVHVNPNQPPVVEISQNWVPEAYWTGDNMSFELDVEDYDGNVSLVELYAGVDLVATITENFYYGISWQNISSGNWAIQAKAFDESGAVGLSNVINVVVSHRLAIDGIISCLESSDQPQLVFGLVSDKNQLLFINPQTGQLSGTYTFPEPQPMRMAYSASDNKLYIISNYSGNVNIFDVDNKTFSSYNFSLTADGRDIDIEAVKRRIYIAASDGFYIMDMDNGAIIYQDNSDECWNLAVMSDPDKLFVNMNDYTDNLKRYAINSTQLVLEESIEGSSEQCHSIIITSDNTKLIIPCLSQQNISAFNPLMMDDIMGIYDIDSYADQVCVSQDAQYLFVTSWDNLSIFNAKTYVFIKEYHLPNTTLGYSRLGVNNDGSMLLIYNYDTYYENDSYLYFIQKDW